MLLDHAETGVFESAIEVCECFLNLNLIEVVADVRIHG